MSAGADLAAWRTTFGRQELVGVACVALVLAGSNYAIRFVINDWLTWAAFLYPVSFLVVDCMNRVWGPKSARHVTYAGFVVGVPISFAFNFTTPGADQSAAEAALLAARIAGASGFAFLVAQLLDIRVFNLLRGRVWWLAPAASSGAGSVTDTFLFFFGAFAFTEVPWVTLALGDLAVKVAMIALLLPPYRLVVGALVRRASPATGHGGQAGGENGAKTPL